MTLLMLVTILVTTNMCHVNGQSACKTPTGEAGQCLDINKCKPLLTTLKKPHRTSQDYEIIKRSQCGFREKIPIVCCPKSPPQPTSDKKCLTPDNREGKCISVYSCPRLSSLLQQPMFNAVRTFILNSRCQGPDLYSVCCATSSTTIVPVTRPAVCTPSAEPPDPRTECCGLHSGNSNRITGLLSFLRGFWSWEESATLLQLLQLLLPVGRLYVLEIFLFLGHAVFLTMFSFTAIPNIRTIGGNETAIDQYPWLVIIEYIYGTQIELLCGGVLISARYVLTAGHCVAGSVMDVSIPMNVRLGEYDTTNSGPDCVEVEGGGKDCTTGALTVPIEKIIRHPNYDPNDRLRRNDIALIRLSQTAPYTDFIRPICLPSTDVTVSPRSDMSLYAAGWGAVDMTTSSSNIKMHVDLPYSPPSECEAVYNQKQFNIQLWKGQLCAGGELGKDSCKGDSGGPLMYENGRLYEVVGIVSFGPKPCGQLNVPGVYTKVYEYLPWIRSQIKR